MIEPSNMRSERFAHLLTLTCNAQALVMLHRDADEALTVTVTVWNDELDTQVTAGVKVEHDDQAEHLFELLQDETNLRSFLDEAAMA